jgi:hypothetical protein
MHSPKQFIASRIFRLAVLTLLAIMGWPAIPGLSRLIIPTGLVSAATNVSAVSESIAIYRWNLADAGQPLISLPDHIEPGVDLSLSYPMDQFEFPLFQSVYYNQSARKYILMVISRQGRRAQFIDLNAGQSRPDSVGLSFSDEGDKKLLSTEDGTIYTFAPLGDGELHCSQIKNRDGSFIKLHYNREASLDQITGGGRNIDFSYTGDYVSAITQTWGPKASKKQTWAVAADRSFTSQRSFAHALVSKHIPSNATRASYTTEMAASDLTLAAIFGGAGAVAAANGFEPSQLGSRYPLYRGDLIGDDGRLRRGHLSLAMHLYGNEEGTGALALYVPAGFISHSELPTPTDAAITFYYPRLGRLTNVTLAVFHIANFQLSDDGGRVRIGTIGGPGGSVGTYRHSHIEFYNGDTGLPASSARPNLRIDPATVFEVTREAFARARVSQSERPGY